MDGNGGRVMCDYEEDYTLKSTDDFYTYNDRSDWSEDPFNNGEDPLLTEVKQAELWAHVPDEEYEQGPWGYDPFGPDAETWATME